MKILGPPCPKLDTHRSVVLRTFLYRCCLLPKIALSKYPKTRKNLNDQKLIIIISYLDFNHKVNSGDVSALYSDLFKTKPLLKVISFIWYLLHFHQKLNPPSILHLKSIEKNFRRKKIKPGIRPQKYPLGQSSWRPFLKKLPYHCDFENLWVNSPTCRNFNTHMKVVLHFFILILLLPKVPVNIVEMKKN